MKKIIIAKDPEQAAIKFAKDMEEMKPTPNFSMIPRSIGSSVEFWVKIVELNPNFIAQVPEEILECEEFCKSIDHQLFYKYIPPKYLTVEDYNIHNTHPERAISVFRRPAEISDHESFVLAAFEGFHKYWYRVEEYTPETLLMGIDEINSASDILPELWSQELADLIWNAPVAFVSYNGIPENFRRAEWVKMVDFINSKRYSFFRLGRSSELPGKLAEYWGQFDTVEKLNYAIEVEKKINSCQNPYGYTEYRFKVNIPEGSYENFWNAISSVVGDSKELLQAFFELYGSNFSRVIPIELVNLEWIRQELALKSCYRHYRMFISKVESAESEVEKLTAKDKAEEYLTRLKKLVLKYHFFSEEELEVFLKDFMEMIDKEDRKRK